MNQLSFIDCIVVYSLTNVFLDARKPLHSEVDNEIREPPILVGSTSEKTINDFLAW